MWCFVYFVLWLVCLLIVWCQQHQSKCYKSICLQWVDRQLAILWQMGLRAPVKFGLHGSISFCNRLLRLYNFHLWLRCLNCESRTFVLDIVWVLVFPWEPLRATLYLYIILWIYDWMVHAVHVHGTCSTYMYIVSCVCMHLLISLIFFVFIMCMWMHSCFEMWFWVWIYLSCGVEILQCPEGWSHPGLGCQKGSSSAHTFSFLSPLLDMHQWFCCGTASVDQLSSPKRPMCLESMTHLIGAWYVLLLTPHEECQHCYCYVVKALQQFDIDLCL